MEDRDAGEVQEEEEGIWEEGGRGKGVGGGPPERESCSKARGHVNLGKM